MSAGREFSFRVREQNLKALAREQFDVLVIGGGITGAGVARDAALRGLSVGLVERRDFASGTSSRSSKLIHGGLRYLQQGDVGLVREAASERYIVRRLAPHLARPIQMLVPTRSRSGYAKLSFGLWTYDRLAGVAEDERYRMLDRDETLALEPPLRSTKLNGTGLYYEYITDDARLVIEVLKSAATLGAVIANHAEVTGFLSEKGRTEGVTVRDQFTGGELTVSAGVVINATGPWVDGLRLLNEPHEKRRLHLTKGIHVGLRRQRLSLSRIVVMKARDRRGVFAVPRGAVTYLGTTDTDYPHAERNPTISFDDVSYLLDAANRTFAITPALGPGDVLSAWAGLRPLLHQEGKQPTEISRKDEIMVGRSGLVSIAGGKLTTFRRMAERVVDIACGKLQEVGRPLSASKGASDEVMLGSGGTGDDVDDYAHRLKQRTSGVDGDIVDRLVQLYGSNAQRLMEMIGADAARGERVSPELAVTRAEVEYAVEEEMAMTLEDFLERRSRLLLWDPDSGLTAAERVASIMGGLLRWDAGRVRREITTYQAYVDRLKSFVSEGADTGAAHAAHG